MYILVAEFTIAAADVEKFGRLIDKQAKDSVELEADCHQFDVCQEESDPSKFLLYEIYTDKAAFERHRAMPHTASFLGEITTLIRERSIRGFSRRYPS